MPTRATPTDLNHGDMNELPVHVLEQLLGPPVEILELKHKPDQRYTVRASGKRRWAVVKVYRSNRAPVVAARVRSLSGPPDPAIPGVLHVEPSGPGR